MNINQQKNNVTMINSNVEYEDEEYASYSSNYGEYYGYDYNYENENVQNDTTKFSERKLFEVTTQSVIYEYEDFNAATEKMASKAIAKESEGKS